MQILTAIKLRLVPFVLSEVSPARVARRYQETVSMPRRIL